MNTVLALKSLLRAPTNITTQEIHPPLTMPASQFSGITALPVELWSLIIEYTVLHRISQNAPPFNECTAALDLRLVCRMFNKEVMHALHTHISIAHLPQTSSVSLLLSFSQLPHKHALFSSAVLNSCRTTSLPTVSAKLVARIVNCLIMSSSLSRVDGPEPHWDLTFTEELSAYDHHAMDMLRRLCRAAGLSGCCQEYMCKPDVFYAKFGKDGELQADKHLEIAILVASGYDICWITKCMVRLERIGRLVGRRSENGTRGR